MANEPSAPAAEPDVPTDDEYQAFLAALSATARGRAFLAEYARRERGAETESLLKAIRRLESLVDSQATGPAPASSASSVHDELRGLLDAMRGVQAEIDIGGLAIRMAKLISLIDVIQHRIECVVGGVSVPVESSVIPDKQTGVEKLSAPTEEEIIVTEISPEAAVIPETAATANIALEESDEPISSAEATPAIDEAAQNEVSLSEAPPIETPAQNAISDEPLSPAPAHVQPGGMPEVAWGENPVATSAGQSTPAPARMAGPPEPKVPISAALAIAAVVEQAVAASEAEAAKSEPKVIKAGANPPASSFTGDDFSATPAHMIRRSRAADALTPITLLSDDERLALFT